MNEDRDAIAARIGVERRAALVHPFDDPNVIAGQGTAGLELMEQAALPRGATPDEVLVPCLGRRARLRHRDCGEGRRIRRRKC